MPFPRRAALGGLLGLAACAERIAPGRAGLALPARFVEARGLAPAMPDAAWWRGFNAPELDALMARLDGGNTDIAQAEARIRQADAQLRITGAALLPSLELDASASRQRANTSGRALTSSSHSLTGYVSYELDFWGKNRASAEAARQSLRYAEFDAATVRLTQQASLAQTYFELVEAEAELAMQRQNVEAARRILGVLRAQFAAGTATGLDVVQQETTLAQEEAKLPALEQTAAQDRNTIAVLLGEAPEGLRLLGADLDALAVPRPAPGLPAEVIARRPDVAAAEALLASYDADIAAARAALLPSVSLTGEAGWSASALNTLFNPASQIWSLAGSLTQTIFDGGAKRGQVALSEAQAEEQLHAYRAAILTALKEVENAIIGLRQSEEQERRLRIAAERAARAQSIAEAQLRGGTVNLTTVLQTQQTLFSARISLVQARLSTLDAAVTLFKALGGGWR